MLFTRCPNCETTFRITDQALRKAAGQVRCGRCACVFDAYAELREQRGEASTRAAEAGTARAGNGTPAGDGAAAAEESARASQDIAVRREADAKAQHPVSADVEHDADAPQHESDAQHEGSDETRGDVADAGEGGGVTDAEIRLEAAEDAAVAEGASAARDPVVTERASAALDPVVAEGASAADDVAIAEDADAAAENVELVSGDAAAGPDSPLDADAEWFATATLFIVEAAASERSEPAPPSSARAAPPPPPQAPTDEVLDDYSVAAVLEQIESSTLAAENETADEEKAAKPSGSADSARVLNFEAGEPRSGGAANRERRGAQDSGGDAAAAPDAASAASRAGPTSAAAKTPTRKTAAAGTAAAKDSAPAGAAVSPDTAASRAAAPLGDGAKAADVARAPAATGSATFPWHSGGALEPPPFAQPARRASGAWLYASIGALLLLGAQLTNHFRSDLARVDALGPVLRNLYGRIGIDLIPRWDLAEYRIVDWVATAEPNAKGRGSLRITAQIRNEGRRAQPYPLVHLQLKDRWEKSVASRMFRPVEYLSSRERADRLMPPGATARAELEVVDPGPDAYGFELDVCILQPDKSVRCAADDVFR